MKPSETAGLCTGDSATILPCQALQFAARHIGT